MIKTIHNRQRGYWINGELFARKSDVLDRCRCILYGTKIGERVSDDSFKFLAALISFHQSADDKVGAGIDFITAEQNPQYPTTRGFWIHRVDGSKTDFSFIECVSPSSLPKKVTAALREAVCGQILEFKNEHFEAVGELSVCTVTAAQVTRDDCHVDHAPPNTFERIVADFMTAEGIEASDVQLLPHTDAQSFDRLADPFLEAKWKSFHRDRARLRIVSRRANLSDVKRMVQS